MTDLKLAVTVRCGGKGGQCRRVLGRAYAASGTLWLRAGKGPAPDSTRPTRPGRRVSPDFAGQTSALHCPEHGYTLDHPLARPVGDVGVGYPWPLVARSGRVLGGAVFPLAELRQPYERFLATGKPQTITWHPGAS